MAALYAFSFLGSRRAMAQGLLIAVAYAIELVIDPAGLPPIGSRITSWLFVVGVSFCSGLLLLALSEGLRRSERRFRSGKKGAAGAGMSQPAGGVDQSDHIRQEVIRGEPGRVLEVAEDRGEHAAGLDGTQFPGTAGLNLLRFTDRLVGHQCVVRRLYVAYASQLSYDE